MSARLLGIDLGTSAVKVVLTTFDGAVIASASAEYPIEQPQPDYAEQEPAAWLRVVADAVRATFTRAPTAPIAAIGLSGQMHGTVLLGADHQPLGPAIIWPDRRSAREVQEITERVGPERLYAITGSPVATGFQAATVRWVQRHAPELWRRVRRILLPKDYLRFWLTGVFATDPSDAAGTLLFDETRRDWSDELLDFLEIRRDQLPPVQPSASICGRLCEDAASALGLPVGVPVATGAADTACSLLGAGVARSDQLLLTISTGGQLVQPCEAVRIDAQGRIHTFCSALEPGEGRSGWYQMGAMLAAGLALRWLREQLYEEPANISYDQMMRLASEAPPGADGLLFLPYLIGERTPYMDPTARGVFFGLTLRHRRSHLIRAIVEGVTLAARNAYDVLRELGAASQHVVLAGGGARSRFWQQVVADVFGTPVHALRPADQSAAGACILAGAASGAFDPAEAAHTWAHYEGLMQPDSDRHCFYQGRLEAFRALYQRNAGHFGP
ncbi:MAG: xylulokinase [Candidatus Roseilinea sp.]|uniref:xylulokinase n=1 Tax=Candidatus Roseilinea sp. TaxID=2838777 RepID=UPI00404ABEF4